MASKRFSIRFSEIDVSNPQEVASFIEWLYDGVLPEDVELKGGDVLKIDPERQMEIEWGMQAPKRRTAKLLWQLLVENSDEDFFRQRFTVNMQALAEDSKRSSNILPSILERLRSVISGYARRMEEDKGVGQGWWGEEWWLPAEEAEYMRSQLRRVKPDLLERASDYEDALRLHLYKIQQYWIGGVAIAADSPERCYVGSRTPDPQIVVETNGCQHELIMTYFCKGLEWGYGGYGPSCLAERMIIDATGGDLQWPRKLKQKFVLEVISELPHKEFRLPWREVANWLAGNGMDDDYLSRRHSELEEKQKKFQHLIDVVNQRIDRIASLPENMRVQRFDLVPPDFECALYVDLMQWMQQGGYALRCSRCGLTLGLDYSPKANRQLGRWRSGRPIYHDHCSIDMERERKRKYWDEKSEDPEFRKKERQRAQAYRREVMGS